MSFKLKEGDNCMKKRVLGVLIALLCLSLSVLFLVACDDTPKVPGGDDDHEDEVVWDTDNIVWDYENMVARIYQKGNSDNYEELDIDYLGENVIQQATCTQEGISIIKYVIYFNGDPYYSKQEVTIPTSGHDWYVSYYEFNETDDGYIADAHMRCDICSTETIMSAKVVSEVTQESSCDVAGQMTLTASVEGYSFKTTKTITLPLLDHVFDGDYCTVCNQHKPTEGLEIVWNDFWKGYTVKSLGTATDKDIYIPSSYEGEKVYAVYSEVYNNDKINSITIPTSITNFYAGSSNEENNSTLTAIYYSGTIDQWSQIGFDTEYGNPINPLIYGHNLYIGGQLAQDITINVSPREDAFIGASITSVTLTENVEIIRTRVFQDCTSLKTVTMASGVTTIDDYAFYNCTSLDSIEIADTVKTIGDYAFENCYSLESVVIPDSVTELGNNYGKVFYNCTNLKNVKLSSGLTTLYNTFGNCISLESIEIPNSITKIDRYAFSRTGLKSIEIPSTVTSIGYYAFNQCTNLSSVTFDGNLDSIDQYAFAGCTSLTSISIPNGVTELPQGAFSGCENLVNVELPDTLTTINSSAFDACYNLQNITLPESLSSINSNAFSQCYKLYDVFNFSQLTLEKGSSDNGYVAYYAKSIYTSADDTSNTVVSDDDFVFYTDGDTTYLTGYRGTEIDLVLPDNFNDNAYQIAAYAFYNNKNLRSVTLPNTITTIGEYAFGKCSRLSSVTLSDKLVTIGEYAFYDCVNLTSITIPASVKSCPNYAFSGCAKLLEVYKLSSSISVAGNVVTHTRATDSSILYRRGDFVFYNDGETRYLVAYEGNEKDIVLPTFNNYKIYKYAFYNRTDIESVVIDSGVTGIGERAFQNCTNLKNIEINVEYDYVGTQFYVLEHIEEYAFYNTAYYNNDSNWENGVLYIGNFLINGSASVKVVVKDGTTLIADHAFSDKALASITLPKELRFIGCYAFYNCSKLKEVVSNNDYTLYIGKEAFRSCNSMEKFSTKDIVSIGANAFNSCSDLTSFTLSPAIETIGDDAFAGCRKLVEIYNLSDSINVVKGSDDNGGIGKYAIVIHTSANEESSIKTEGDYTYVEGADRSYLMSYNGTDAEITLPETLGNKPYDIYSWAFARNNNLFSVVLNSCTKEIGDSAFNGCESLKTVTIPEGVEKIGSYAFCGNALESIVIPNSVTSIGDNAFSYCSMLASVTLSNNLTQIPEDLLEATAFYNNSDNWENGALYVGTYLIAYNDLNATSYEIKDGTTIIADYAFGKWGGTRPKLTEIIVPSSIKYIGKNAFYVCYDLRTMDLSATSITVLNSYTFYNLDTIILPETLETISAYALGGRYHSYGSITFNSNPTIDLGEADYIGIYDGGTITLGAKVTDFDFSIFSDVSTVIVSEENTVFSSVDGIVYNETSIVYVPTGVSGAITIPDTITSIGEKAFYGRSNLTSVVIGEGVQTIGAQAFDKCTNLATIKIGSNVKTIGADAFANTACYNNLSAVNSFKILDGWVVLAYSGSAVLNVTDDMKFVDNVLNGRTYYYNGAKYESYVLTGVPDDSKETIKSYVVLPGTIEIKERAFENCTNMEAIYIPDSVVKIGKEIFWGATETGEINIYFQTALSDINFGSNGVNLDYKNFATQTVNGQTQILYIATAYVHTGMSKTDEGLIYQVTESKDGNYIAVYGYVGNNSALVIPKTIENLSVTTIGELAFQGNTTIESVTINAPITTIAQQAFAKCTSLTTFTGYNITAIMSYAFYGCTNLSTVNLEQTSEASNLSISIGKQAFGNCTSLESITLPFAPTFAPESFNGCTNLKSIDVTLPAISGYWTPGTYYVYDDTSRLVATIENCSAEDLVTVVQERYPQYFILPTQIYNGQ